MELQKDENTERIERGDVSKSKMVLVTVGTTNFNSLII